MELAVEEIGRYCGRSTLAGIDRTPPSPWSGTQRLLAHQSLDLVQPADKAFRQNVAPNPTGAIGPVARQKADPCLAGNPLVRTRTLTGPSGQPGMKA
jgi:hypothetical protein